MVSLQVFLVLFSLISLAQNLTLQQKVLHSNNAGSLFLGTESAIHVKRHINKM